MSRVAVAVLMLLAAVACAGRRAPADAASFLRAASDTPDHFVVGAHDGNATSEPGAAPSGECRSPLVDPRDGTKLTLVWSSGGHGEYEVLPGRYGVGNGEVLRVDCATGRALGIGQRRPG